MAIDWGNGSDVIAAVSGALSALGALGAIGVTMWQSHKDRMSVVRLAEQAVHVEAARRYEVVQAAKVIIERIAYLHDRYFEHGEGTAYSFDSSYEAYRRDINAQCDRLLSLQSFGGANPALSIALEQVAAMHRIPDGDKPKYTMQLMRVISLAGAARHQVEDIDRVA